MPQISEHTEAADAYRTTGTSPTKAAPAAPSRLRTYETIHLLGPGAVGRELLERLVGDRRKLIAVTDSTGTACDTRGLDPAQVLRWKRAGLPLSEHPLAVAADTAAALVHADADIVIDTTSTDLARVGWAQLLDAALQRGACVISAAKAALCHAGAEWLSGEHAARIGCNAVLGGTGRSFTAELSDLQRHAHGAAIVGNASTTAIIESIEKGATFGEGIEEARRRGFLEPDPELDLRGVDAAVKLAIVAGVISSRAIDPRAIPCEDIRSLDAATLRLRAARGETTRLVGRWSTDGTLHVRYEALPRYSLLAAPCGRVVYEYRLGRDERRFHIGTGLGAAATADAAWSDVRHIARLAALDATRLAARHTASLGAGRGGVR